MAPNKTTCGNILAAGTCHAVVSAMTNGCDSSIDTKATSSSLAATARKFVRVAVPTGTQRCTHRTTGWQLRIVRGTGSGRQMAEATAPERHHYVGESALNCPQGA